MKSILVLALMCVASLSFSGKSSASELDAATKAKFNMLSHQIDVAVAKGEMTAEQGVDMKIQLVFSWSELAGNAYDFAIWLKDKAVEYGMDIKDLSVTGFWALVEVVRANGCWVKPTSEEMYACFDESWDQIKKQWNNQ